MKKKSYDAFTIQIDQLLNELRSPIKIAKVNEREVWNTWAIWDTGATNSSITSKVVKELGLKPVGKVSVIGVNDEQEVSTYLVDVHLPQSVRVTKVLVSECKSLDDKDEVGVLIGMDIILIGDFAVSNFNSKTTFTFRVPSFGEINFVKDKKRLTRSRGKKHNKR